jgi:hypothetical protein
MMAVGEDDDCRTGLTAQQSRKQTRRVAADIEELESPLETSSILPAPSRQLLVSSYHDVPVLGVCCDPDAMSGT